MTEFEEMEIEFANMELNNSKKEYMTAYEDGFSSGVASIYKFAKDLPDSSGWWWEWNKTYKQYMCQEISSMLHCYYAGSTWEPIKGTWYKINLPIKNPL